MDFIQSQASSKLYSPSLSERMMRDVMLKMNLDVYHEILQVSQRLVLVLQEPHPAISSSIISDS